MKRVQTTTRNQVNHRTGTGLIFELCGSAESLTYHQEVRKIHSRLEDTTGNGLGTHTTAKRQAHSNPCRKGFDNYTDPRTS